MVEGTRLKNGRCVFRVRGFKSPSNFTSELLKQGTSKFGSRLASASKFAENASHTSKYEDICRQDADV